MPSLNKTTKYGRQEGNLGPLDNQTSTLPLEPFWLCPCGETVVTKMFKLVNLWGS